MQRERLVNSGPSERFSEHMTTTIMETTLSNLYISLVRGEIACTFLPKYSHDKGLFFVEQTPFGLASMYIALRSAFIKLIINSPNKPIFQRIS